MAEEEKDPERFARVLAIVNAIKSATADHKLVDTQMALGNVIAQFAIASDDPQMVFLTTMAAIVDVYTGTIEHLKEGKPPNTIQGVPN